MTEIRNSTYYIGPHRVPHHVFVAAFVGITGLLLAHFVTLSTASRTFILCVTAVEAGSRLFRAAMFFVGNKDAHPQRIVAHLAEVLLTASGGAWLAHTYLEGENIKIFFALIFLRVAKHVVQILDHYFSWREELAKERKILALHSSEPERWPPASPRIVS